MKGIRTVVAVLALSFIASVPDSALAELTPGPTSWPYYFLDTSVPFPNSHVLLSGSGNIVVNVPTIPYRPRVDGLRSAGMRYARMWHMQADINRRPWKAIGPMTLDYTQWNDSPYPHPAAACVPDSAPVGNTYWEQLRDAITYSNDRGLVVEIHLFDRGGIGWNTDGLAPSDFYTNPLWGSRQRDFVTKMIAETAACPLVTYEIENEPQAGVPSSWQEYWTAFVKAELANQGSQRIVSASAQAAILDLENVDTLNYHPSAQGYRDWTNLDMTCTNAGPNCVLPYLSSERAVVRQTLARGRAVSVDEFGNSLGPPIPHFPLSLSDSSDLLRMLTWTYVSSGAHVHIEDAEDTIGFAAITGLGNLLSEWAFWLQAPTDTITVAVLRPSGSGGAAPPTVTAVQGYCMTNGVGGGTMNGPRMCYVPAVPDGATSIQASGLGQASLQNGGRWSLGVWDPRTAQWAVDGHTASSTATTAAVSLPSVPPGTPASKRDWVLLASDTYYPWPVWQATTATIGTGDGLVTSWPAALSCGTTGTACAASFSGPVTLMANPQAGSIFSGWSGACSGASCQLPAGGAASAMATFTFTANITGYIDGVYESGGQSRLRGWACALGWPSSVSVHVYRSGPAGGGGTFLTSAQANTASEPTVAAACQSTGSAYRFDIGLDQWSAPYHGEALWLYGISPFGRANLSLYNSGAFRIPGANSIVATSASSCVNGCSGAWGNARAVDNNVATAWSSAYHPGTNGYESFVITFDAIHNVDYVKIVPRTHLGTNRCVPEFVNVYTLVNGQWSYVVTVNLPANIPQTGYVISFANRATSSMLLDTNRLRDDGAGGYYFQMAEVSAGTK